MLTNYNKGINPVHIPLYISQKSFNSQKEIIKFYVLDRDKKINIEGKKGEKLLDVCKKYNINLIGACEGGCACSTCHVILEKDLYNKLPFPSEKEEDILDGAPELTPTSRLSCQILLDNNFSGTKIKLPSRQKNIDLTLFKNKNKLIWKLKLKNISYSSTTFDSFTYILDLIKLKIKDSIWIILIISL